MPKVARRPRLRVMVACALIAGALGAGAGLVHLAEAADHLDPPGRTNPMSGGMDRNADIADVFAWHQGAGAEASVVTVLSFAGPNMPAADQAIPCDRDVLYAIHVSNDADADPEHTIYARFGQDDLDNCFVSVSGIPGVTGAIEGPVELAMERSDARVFAGLRDDAFFFDLQGFQETLSMGTIRMTNDRDFFAGQNTPALVVEFPLSAVSTEGQDFRVWATTARFPS